MHYTYILFYVSKQSIAITNNGHLYSLDPLKEEEKKLMRNTIAILSVLRFLTQTHFDLRQNNSLKRIVIIWHSENYYFISYYNYFFMFIYYNNV